MSCRTKAQNFYAVHWIVGSRLLKLRMRKLKMNFWWDIQVLKPQVIFKDLAGKWTCIPSWLVQLLLSIISYVYMCNFSVMKGEERLSIVANLFWSCKFKILLNYMIKNICFSAGEYLRETHTFLLWLCGTGPATQQTCKVFQIFRKSKSGWLYRI